MTIGEAFRQCLIDLDEVKICELWFAVSPHLPQPKNNYEALVSIHHARTLTQSIPARLRCYSHAWLTERSLPSGLPDHLKPKADRMYPRKVEAVGIAVKALTADTNERARAKEKAMSDAVLECYADGVRDPEIIKARMREAAARV